MSQLTIDFAARDRILSAHQRKALVRWLEWECFQSTHWLGDGTITPVSANTARAICRAWDVTLAEPRLLGGVFHHRRWRQVGEVTSDSGVCHARKIRLFLPRADAEFAPADRPAWIRRAA